MVNCTNIKSVVETGKCRLVTSIEMKRFIGCNIFMSSLGYPRMRIFWAKTTRVPLISNTMSRNRFFKIRSFFKVVNDNVITTEEKKDSLWKVCPLLEAVRTGCYRLVRDVHLSIDEQIIPFTGNTKMKQFVTGKPNPTGLKNFILANKHGLVLDFCIYQGKGSSFITESKCPLTVGESAVIHLSMTIPSGTCLYFDRFFTMQKLLDILKTKKILSTGTGMKNNIPKAVNLVSDKILLKKPRGTTIQYVREDKKVCLIQWFDNKPKTGFYKGVGDQKKTKATPEIGVCSRLCESAIDYHKHLQYLITSKDDFNKIIGELQNNQTSHTTNETNDEFQISELEEAMEELQNNPNNEENIET